MPINTIQQLREHLLLAIKVELSTVPPYLYAMYSIEDQTSDAPKLIRSVVAEEMLHAALATNLLLAVGGRPDFTAAEMIPTYPGVLPHHQPPLQLRLEPCSTELINELFLAIEQPELHEAIPEEDEYETLGQFYHALELGLTHIAKSHDVFANPQASRQMSDASFYVPVAFDADDSGGLLLIDDLDSAREAIHIIIHQGEGLSDEKWADPEHKELTHYHKFLEIAEGRVPMGNVLPALSSPTAKNFPESVRPVAELFNAAYRYVYLTMDEIFQPAHDKKRLVGRLYDLMSDVLSPTAHYLLTQSVGDRVAGPTFEIYEFAGPPHAQLLALAMEAAETHPSLNAVVGAIEGL